MKESHLKGAVTVEWFEKFSLNFSISLFAIRVNLLHPQPSLFLCGLYYLFGTFHLCKLLFSGFLQLNSNFVDGQNNSKYHD